MRSPLDRLRHALSFEILALLLVVPLGSILLDRPIGDIGVVGVFSAIIATLWTYFYNFAFDVGLNRLTGTTLKKAWMRVLHTILFEMGLLVALMPFVAWYLDVSIRQAFLLNLSFSLFYVVYAFAFNWSYDRVFPLTEWTQKANRGSPRHKKGAPGWRPHSRS